MEWKDYWKTLPEEFKKFVQDGDLMAKCLAGLKKIPEGYADLFGGKASPDFQWGLYFQVRDFFKSFKGPDVRPREENDRASNDKQKKPSDIRIDNDSLNKKPDEDDVPKHTNKSSFEKATSQTREDSPPKISGTYWPKTLDEAFGLTPTAVSERQALDMSATSPSEPARTIDRKPPKDWDELLAQTKQTTNAPERKTNWKALDRPLTPEQIREQYSAPSTKINWAEEYSGDDEERKKETVAREQVQRSRGPSMSR